MEKLRKRRRKREHKLERRQAFRDRIRKFIRWAKKRGFKGLAERSERVEKRLTKRIKELHAEIAEIDAQIDVLQQQRDNDRKDFVQWLRSKVGVDENGSEADSWNRDLGYGDSSVVPWCSTTVGYGLKHIAHIPLPANPAYSGAWLNWSYGTRVSYSQRQEGDLLIFDWGDGGITDHVATYVGDGKMIGGNQRDYDSGGQVSEQVVPTGAIVGVVRPKWDS